MKTLIITASIFTLMIWVPILMYLVERTERRGGKVYLDENGNVHSFWNVDVYRKESTDPHFSRNTIFHSGVIIKMHQDWTVTETLDLRSAK